MRPGRTSRAWARIRGGSPPPRSPGASSSEEEKPSSDASCAVCDLRRHERIAERALELRSDFNNTDPRAGLDSDRVARGEVGTGRVRAHDLLVSEDGPLDR